VCVSIDSHSTDGYANLRWGTVQARRGWLAPGDVRNSGGLRELPGRALGG